MPDLKKKPILLIMAAGMGSRYGGLKQIDPVGDHGEIILDFSLYDAMLAGFERAVFVIKEENAETFRGLIDGRAGRCIDVDYAFQKLDDIPEGYEVPEGREKPWGTAHAVYAARDLIDAPFCVINADDYYGPGAFQTMYEFLEGLCDKDADPEGGEALPDDYSMVAFQLDRTLTENGHVARGVCEVAPGGILSKVTERTKIMWREIDGRRTPAFTEDDGETWSMLAPDTPVSMNFWGFGKSFMDAVRAGFPEFLDRTLAEDPLKGEYFLPSVVSERIASGSAVVHVLKSSDQWYGVTYKEDRETVVNALQAMKDRGFYPDKLWD